MSAEVWAIKDPGGWLYEHSCRDAENYCWREWCEEEGQSADYWKSKGYSCVPALITESASQPAKAATEHGGPKVYTLNDEQFAEFEANMKIPTNAKLKLHLVAESGYESEEETTVNAEQWEKIQRVLNGTEIKAATEGRELAEPAGGWKGGGPLIPQAKGARIGKAPCGECHLQPGEICDICGAQEDIDPRNWS